MGRRQIIRYTSSVASPRMEQVTAWAELLGVDATWLATGGPTAAAVQQFQRAHAEGRTRKTLLPYERRASEVIAAVVAARLAGEPVDPDLVVALARKVLDPDLRRLAEHCIGARDSDPARCAELGVGMVMDLESSVVVMSETAPPREAPPAPPVPRITTSYADRYKQALAAAGGKHSYYVSRALTGDDRLNEQLRMCEGGTIPTRELSDRVAAFLQVDPDWLMHGRGRP